MTNDTSYYWNNPQFSSGNSITITNATTTVGNGVYTVGWPKDYTYTYYPTYHTYTPWQTENNIDEQRKLEETNKRLLDDLSKRIEKDIGKSHELSAAQKRVEELEKENELLKKFASSLLDKLTEDKSE